MPDLADLLIKSALAGVARDAHYVLDNSSAEYVRTLLMEPARAKLLLHNEDYGNAAWTKTNATIGANAIAGPDGQTTADALIPAAGSNAVNISQAATVVSGEVYTYSAHLRNGTLGNPWHQLVAGAYRGWFNLATGAKGGSSGSPISYNITALADGWFRADITFTTAGTSETCYVVPSPADNVNGAITGDAASPSCYLTRLELEQGEFPTTSMVTAAATATREVDELSYPFALAPQEMTIYLRFVVLGLTGTGLDTLLTIGSIAITPCLWLRWNAGAFGVYHHNGTSGVTATVAAAPVRGDLVELRVLFNANGSVQIGVAINGGVETLGAATAANALALAWSPQAVHVCGDVQGYAYAAGINHGAAAIAALVIARRIRTLAWLQARL